MREYTVDRMIASGGAWTGLREFEAEIQAGLSRDGITVTPAPGAKASSRNGPKLRPVISGMALLGLAVVAWLAGPESRPSAATARASATSHPASTAAPRDRASSRPVALRPGLSD